MNKDNKMNDMKGGSSPNHIAIQKFLKGVNYPAKKQALIEHAKGNNAPEDVLASLGRLPEKEYRNPAELTKEIGSM